MAAKIRKGDLVRIMVGRDKGEEGRVIRVQPAKRRVWIENINIIHRHTRGVAGQTESEIVRKEAPIDISNVMLIDPETKEPTRVGFKFIHEVSEDERKRLEKEGHTFKPRKVRYAKKSGTVLDD